MADLYETGFCNIGSHEGTKPKSISGRPMQVCTYYTICTCNCHKTITRMYEMTGQTRSSQQNPDYVPDVLTAWMPSYEDRVASSIARATRPTIVVESPAPALVPATVARSYAPTPTGRAGRGQLEQWVKEAVDAWLVELPDTPCSVGWIAVEVGKQQQLKTVSPGAIQAVLERWVSYGYATMGKKPVRFTGYTVEGVKLGLDALKVRAKMNRDRKNAAVNRGERK